MAAAVAMLVGFVRYELGRHKKGSSGGTLLVPEIFRHRSFSAGVGVAVIFEMAMIGFFFIFTLALQLGLGFSALKTALIGIPTAVGVSLSTALFSQKLLPKLGSRLMTIGSVLMALGLAGIAFVLGRYGLSTQWWQLAPGLLVFGIAMGMFFGAMFAVVFNDVEPRYAGAASGMLNAMQQVGGAVGIALIGVLFFGAVTNHATASFQSIKPELQKQLSTAQVPPPSQNPIIKGLKTCYTARVNSDDPSKTPKSCQQPGGHSSPRQQKIGSIVASAAQKANQQNFTHAFKLSSAYAIGLLAVTFALSFLLPTHLKHPEAANEML
jgi:hypothetical protein